MVVSWPSSISHFSISRSALYQSALISTALPRRGVTTQVGDWVVTPRRGKAVEINALWYNALRLMEKWLMEEGQETTMSRMRETADRVLESFNQRFWYEQGAYLYDVVDEEN